MPDTLRTQKEIRANGDGTLDPRLWTTPVVQALSTTDTTQKGLKKLRAEYNQQHQDDSSRPAFGPADIKELQDLMIVLQWAPFSELSSILKLNTSSKLRRLQLNAFLTLTDDRSTAPTIPENQNLLKAIRTLLTRAVLTKDVEERGKFKEIIAKLLKKVRDSDYLKKLNFPQEEPITEAEQKIVKEWIEWIEKIITFLYDLLIPAIAHVLDSLYKEVGLDILLANKDRKLDVAVINNVYKETFYPCLFMHAALKRSSSASANQSDRGQSAAPAQPPAAACAQAAEEAAGAASAATADDDEDDDTDDLPPLLCIDRYGKEFYDRGSGHGPGQSF